ncbi:hypothetical protein pdam_00008878 [Pocillopora damicornis]|uniref:Proline-rich transmembrane protein 3/4 domain-containing protein n=1 Tax=Pocillopora damicornis TaxID=46731 RepID=A0A3M6TJS3_POCDA|nr:hypothetical protein pdam_00008878 [Pocillopora damicornis]
MSNTTPFSEPESSVSQDIPYEEPTAKVAFEPLPKWDQAKETWQWVWDLHWAGFGSLFALIALYALWSLINLAKRKHRRKPLLAMAISSLLFLFGSSRAAFFFINPYESKECFLPTSCPVILTRTLFGIALPCITASFFLVHLAFLQLSKLTLYPEKLQSVKCVDLGLGCTLAYVNPRQVPHRRRSRSTIFLRNCKLIAGSSLYVQNNQSSAESGDLASPPPTAKTSVRTLVEIGIENEGGNFIFHEEEDKK